ncbi:hypothetical protein NO108_04895 [Planktothrix rubescens]|nr:hypothetical protein NO108_04895 [Planktothrix rubescens]
MNALTAVTATAYAIALWMFAPESVWRREVEQAKQNQQNRLNPIPEPIPQLQIEPIQEPIPETVPTPEFEASAQPETTPEPITAIVEPIPDTKPIEPDTVPKTELLNLETFTTTKLRELAKKQKLNWRPLVNGKRTPLKKPELIQLLTA